MKKSTLILIFVLVFCNVFGQSVSDTITVKKAIGTVFQQNGKNLAPRDLLKITEANPEAYNEMKIAKSNNDAASVFGFIGGALIGWPIGTAIAGGEPNWALAGIGVGVIVIAIPFSTAYTKHAKNAVRIYNEGLKQTLINKTEFKFGLLSYGIGVGINF